MKKVRRPTEEELLGMTKEEFELWRFELIRKMDKALADFEMDSKFVMLLIQALPISSKELIPSYRLMIGGIKNFITYLGRVKQEKE